MGTQGRGIVVMGADIAFFGCYVCGMQLKDQTATRRWNPQQKCWMLHARELPKAWAVLKAHHPEAQIVDEDGVKQPEPEQAQRRTQKSWWEEEYIRRLNERKKQQSKSAPPPSRLIPPTWADLMFASVPESLHETVFKSLLRVLHPDAGGDAEAVDALLKAREKRKGVA